MPNSHNVFRIPYEKELNPSQLEAVLSTQGPMLIIAGAGSGKTRTLTYRVARLVEDGVPPQSILLLTFTRKASSEMLKRASLILDQRCSMVSGGTFHSFANTILHKYSSEIGFPDGFSIIDRPDSENLIGILRKEAGYATKNRHFPRKNTLGNIFSRAVNKVLSIEDVIINDYPHFEIEIDAVNILNKEYKRKKREHNFLDYDDLLIYLHILLKDNPTILESLSSKYRYIMVDEYQDTNLIQADIVCLLANEHKNIMVVGDDSQSIYAFRGANFKNIMKFPELFTGTRIIKLEENYRSVQPILQLANMMIDAAEEKYSKKLFTRREGGSVPILAETESEYSQSKFIVEKIIELNKTKKIPLDQIAVLFRAGFHSFDLEIQLTKENIPFIKVGGFKFVESAHIKDLLSHLKVIANPYDRISWYRLLLLLEGIGPKAASNIFDALCKTESGYHGLLEIKLKKKQAAVLEPLKELFSRLDSIKKPVNQLGEAVAEYYAPVLRKKYDDYPRREKDLGHLFTIMERYDDLGRFLADMTLEPPNTSMDKTFSVDNSGNNRLTLSTTHSAKGLEWDTVFIMSVLDGRFPSMRALHNEEDLEEERRLMYVAATRAKNNLYFTYPGDVYDRSTNMTLYNPSCFLDELPEKILKRKFV